MDKQGLDGAFLAACCRFTTLALVVASVIVSTVVSYLGLGQVFGASRSVDNSNFHSYTLGSLYAGFSPASSESLEISEAGPCQSAEASSSSVDNRGRQTVEWSLAHLHSPVTARTGYLKLDHLSVHTVVARPGKHGFKQLTVYFSNVSCRSGMVQVRPEIRESVDYGAAVSCNETPAEWQKRRVPRHGQMAYTVVIQCSENAASMTFQVRGFSSDRLLTVQQASTYVQEAQIVENKVDSYIGSTLNSHGFHASPESERPIADKI